jgi:hypothetical protein
MTRSSNHTARTSRGERPCRKEGPISRYTISLPGRKVAYGFDHALGYFFQEFDAEGEIVVDEDSLFADLNNGRLLERLDGIEGIPEEHTFLIASDLPF